jgi:DNA-3-methyladenine glycosylase
MSESNSLRRDFFARSAVEVARGLLGTRLVRLENGQRLSGVVTETEAYLGEEDLACHARAGRTPRTQVMYGPPGISYVYFTYGMHWLLNVVVLPQGFPAAVLIRGLYPLEGLEVIGGRRPGQPRPRWTDGPAKICQAFGIDGRWNGYDLCAPQAELFFEAGSPVSDSAVTIGPRVGLYTVPEPWKSMPWRFLVPDYPLMENSAS